MKQHLSLHPPAKINLILRVGDRLPNGFHSLWSLMQTVALTDELTIETDTSFTGLRFECADFVRDRPTDNLVYRAAEMVWQKAGASVGIKITLQKQIPIAAGLGGGSSDAAATIMGLNRLLGCDWSLADMIALGKQIGSDVPFFFAAPTAVVEGIGEEISPVRLSGERWMLLVNPGFPIHTKTAYQRLDERRGDGRQVDPASPDLNGKAPLLWEEVIPRIKNDFEDVLLDDYPELRRLKEELLQAGAEAAVVSGSGATVFGVFTDATQAHRAKSRFARFPQYRAFVVPVMTEGLLPESALEK